MVILAYGTLFRTSLEVLIKTQASPYDSKTLCQKKWGTFWGIFRAMNSVFRTKIFILKFSFGLTLGMSSYCPSFVI